MAFPAVKIGALLLKQISKPLANAVKTRAKNSPFFRTYICMPPAQFYHWCDVKLKMWSMNLGRPVSVAPLNENMAIELGAELLGEGIIFSIAVAALTFEYFRSSRREAVKEAERKEELARIQNELKELYFARARQETQMRELLRALHVNIPSLNYSNPTSFDPNDIPEHHRDGAKVEEGSSIYTKMNNWLWAAVDFIVPPVEDSGRQDPSPVFVIKVVDDKGSPGTDSGTTPGSPKPSPPPSPPPSNPQTSEVPPAKPPTECGHNHKV